MKKISIIITDKTHAELLKIQLEKKLNQSSRTALADVTADFLEDVLVKKVKS